jgi:hypothetical protein
MYIVYVTFEWFKILEQSQGCLFGTVLHSQWSVSDIHLN